MIVRGVCAHEAPRLREIRLRSLASDPEAFGATYADDAARPDLWWERGAASVSQRTFVAADEEDRWLGMALVRPDDEAPAEAIVNAMWVAPEARRRGVGRALLDACVAWARERGFAAVRLHVKAANAPARAAYSSAGFAVERVVGDEHVLKRTL